jgi:hypothetical protein
MLQGLFSKSEHAMHEEFSQTSESTSALTLDSLCTSEAPPPGGEAVQKKRLSLARIAAAERSPLREQARVAGVLTPDDLCNRVQLGLSTLAELDRRAWERKVFTELSKAGVHTGAALFMLGIVVNTVDELTPSDVGKLLRYVRINSPWATETLTSLIDELFPVDTGSPHTTHTGREAA